MSIAVPCPNCGTVLKAPDGMAGKKARCKKCQHGFRIPGGDAADSVDSVGDSHHLSAITDSPFAFENASEPPPEPKPTPAAKKSTMSVKSNSPPPPPANDNPFAISEAETPAVEERTPLPARSKEKAAKQSKTAVKESPSKSSYRTKALKSTGGGGGGGAKRLGLMLLAGLLCAGGGAAGLYGFLEYQKSQSTGPAAAVANIPASTTPEPANTPEAEKPKLDAASAGKNAKATKVPSAKMAENVAPEVSEKPAVSEAKKGRTVRVSGGIKIPALGEKPKAFEKAIQTVPLAHAASEAKQILVGGDEGPVVGVLRRTDNGIGGKGVVDTLEVYTLSTQKLREATKIPGDDIKTFPRICDLSPSGDRFACEFPVGKLSVFQLGTENRLLDGHDLKSSSEGKQPGLAAMFFLSDDLVAVFAKNGSVTLVEIGAKKTTHTTEPLPQAANWVARRTVVVQRDRDGEKSKLFAYSAGAIYEIPVKGKPKLALTLPKKPTECLALAVDSSGNRIAVVYKANDPGEHVRLVHGRTGETKFGCDEPLDVSDMGNPMAIEWSRPETFTLLTEKGIGFAFDADANRLIVGLRPSTIKVQQYLDRSHHWCLLPDKADPKKSHLVNVHTPPESYSSLQLDGKWEPYSVGVTLDGTTK